MTLYGYSRQNITPEFPVVMDGFAAREGMSVGVRDPLFVQALALGDGVNTFLFVAMDLIGLDTYRHTHHNGSGQPCDPV